MQTILCPGDWVSGSLVGSLTSCVNWEKSHDPSGCQGLVYQTGITSELFFLKGCKEPRCLGRGMHTSRALGCVGGIEEGL